MNGIQNRLLAAVFLGFIVWTLNSTALAANDSESTEPEQSDPDDTYTDYARTRQTLSKLVPSTMKQRQVMGFSIALVDGQRVVWARGFGYAGSPPNF